MNKIFEKGELILKEGSSGSEAYIINSGNVEISRTSKGKKVVLAVLGENQIFGEMSMIDDRPRSASAIALTDTEVTVIERKEFNELFYSKPEVLTLFLKDIFERLRNIDQAVIDSTIELTGQCYYGGKVILSGITPQAKIALDDKVMEIKKFPLKVGRKTKKSLKDLFSHNDLYLEDDTPYNVSRNHFSIQYCREKFLVVDRGSTLGTIVNDTRIGGPIKKHEIELSENREHTIIVGSRQSPFKFRISIP